MNKGKNTDDTPIGEVMVTIDCSELADCKLGINKESDIKVTVTGPLSLKASLKS